MRPPIVMEHKTQRAAPMKDALIIEKIIEKVRKIPFTLLCILIAIRNKTFYLNNKSFLMKMTRKQAKTYKAK